MNVLIRDPHLGNKAIAEVPVKICGVEHTPAASHYFDVAWLIALDSGLVKAGEKGRYSFEFAQKNLNPYAIGGKN